MVENDPLYGYVEVEVWSDDPSAVEATKATFERIGAGAGPEPFKEHGGKYYVREGFARFAAEKQGYVKRVLVTSSRLDVRKG